MSEENVKKEHLFPCLFLILIPSVVIENRRKNIKVIYDFSFAEIEIQCLTSIFFRWVCCLINENHECIIIEDLLYDK